METAKEISAIYGVDIAVCSLNLHCNPAYAATPQTYQQQAFNL
jgi:hypothetical protein